MMKMSRLYLGLGLVMVMGVVQLQGGDGQALIDAVRMGDLTRVEQLLKSGADVNFIGNHGSTALEEAAEAGRDASTQMSIMQAILDTNRVNNNAIDVLTLIRMLYYVPDRRREREEFYSPPLEWKKRARDIFKRLLAMNPTVVMDAPRLIQMAVAIDDIELAYLLLEAGSPIPDSVFDVAEPNSDMSKLLIAYKSNASDKSKKELAANIMQKHVSSQTQQKEQEEKKRKNPPLSRAERDRAMSSSDRDHALLVSIKYDGNTDARIKELLDAGAHVDARDDAGTTALVRAAELGKLTTVQILLDRGAGAISLADMQAAMRIAQQNKNAQQGNSAQQKRYAGVVELLEKYISPHLKSSPGEELDEEQPGLEIGAPGGPAFVRQRAEGEE